MGNIHSSLANQIAHVFMWYWQCLLMHSQRKIVFKHPNYQAMFIFHVNCSYFQCPYWSKTITKKNRGKNTRTRIMTKSLENVKQISKKTKKIFLCNFSLYLNEIWPNFKFILQHFQVERTTFCTFLLVFEVLIMLRSLLVQT